MGMTLITVPHQQGIGTCIHLKLLCIIRQLKLLSMVTSIGLLSDTRQWGYKECDGSNLDMNIYFPVSFGTMYSVIAIGDVTTSGGTKNTTNVMRKSSSYFTREVSNADIGGWWIAIGI